MSRPARASRPTANTTLIPERIHIHEQLLTHLLRLHPRSAETDFFLQRLDGLAPNTRGNCCPVCARSYSDAKGLRRHVLAATDSSHEELQSSWKALECAWCARSFARRDMVTKHEAVCRNRAAGVKRTRAEMEAEEEEEGQGSGSRSHAPIMQEGEAGESTSATESSTPLRLPSMTTLAMGDPASPSSTYYSREDIM